MKIRTLVARPNSQDCQCEVCQCVTHSVEFLEKCVFDECYLWHYGIKNCLPWCFYSFILCTPCYRRAAQVFLSMDVACFHPWPGDSYCYRTVSGALILAPSEEITSPPFHSILGEDNNVPWRYGGCCPGAQSLSSHSRILLFVQQRPCPNLIASFTFVPSCTSACPRFSATLA